MSDPEDKYEPEYLSGHIPHYIANDAVLQRTRVPGGWLYERFLDKFEQDNPVIACSMAFVPDVGPAPGNFFKLDQFESTFRPFQS